MDSITKSDVLALFKSHVHYSSPTRAKTSIHLASQKPAPTYASEQAIALFEQEVKAAGITADTSGWKEELFAHGEPPVKSVTAYWQPILESGFSTPAIAAEHGRRLAALLEQYPAKSNNLGTLRPESKLIEDPQAVRASRRLTDYPVPVVQWGDLPLAKI